MCYQDALFWGALGPRNTCHAAFWCTAVQCRIQIYTCSRLNRALGPGSVADLSCGYSRIFSADLLKLICCHQLARQARAGCWFLCGTAAAGMVDGQLADCTAEQLAGLLMPCQLAMCMPPSSRFCLGGGGAVVVVVVLLCVLGTTYGEGGLVQQGCIGGLYSM